MSLANWNLTQQRWTKASERFNLLAHVLTSVDMSDSDRISHELMPTLTAVCEWGEPGQYEKIRLLAIRRFADSAHPVVAEQVIKATLMMPADDETLRMIAPLAAVIEASLTGPNRSKDAHMVAWRQFSLALFAFRQGRLEDAGDCARSSLATAGNSQPRTESNRIVLAMVDLKQGRVEQARNTLAEVRRTVERWEAEPFRIQTDDSGLWSNWGIVRILLKDAESMLVDAGG
jgi:hypothetical protein